VRGEEFGLFRKSFQIGTNLDFLVHLRLRYACVFGDLLLREAGEAGPANSSLGIAPLGERGIL